MVTKVSRKKSLKKIILTIVLVVFVIVAALAILEKTNVINLFSTPSKDTAANGPTPEQKTDEQNTNEQLKQDYLDGNYKDKGAEPTTSTPSNPSLTLTTEQEGSSVTVLTKIQSVAEGKCTLTVTNGAKSTSQEAEVIYQPEFSSCAGFSVPVIDLGTGTWNIKLTVTPTGGTAISKSTTLEVK